MDGFITGAPKLRGMIARRQGRARGFADRSFERAANTTLRSGLISWWPLDEATGTRYDRVGANHLTAVNNPNPTDGPNAPATSFVAASSQTLFRLDNPSLRLNSGDWQIASWMRPKSTTSGLNGYFISKYSGGSGFEWTINSVSFPLRLIVGNGGASSQSLSPATVYGRFTPDSWHFVCAGIKNGSMFLSCDLVRAEAALTISPGNSTNPLCIVGFTAGAASPSDIDIGSVGIWSRALAPNEEHKLYNAGLGSSPL